MNKTRTISRTLHKVSAVVLLIVIFPGLVIFGVFAHVDAGLERYHNGHQWARMTFGPDVPLVAALWAPDLPDHMIDKSVVYEILGYEIRSHPEAIAVFGFSIWAFPAVAVVGLANLGTYGLDRWTRRLRRDGLAAELLSSLWMQESRLGDYYQRIHGGFKSRQRGLYARA